MGRAFFVGPCRKPFQLLIRDYFEVIKGRVVKTEGMGIRNPKERGEWAELRFMAKAAERGFRLSKPFGDSARYDVILDLGDRYARVQVKSTYCGTHPKSPKRRGIAFVATLRSQACPPYEAGDFDFLAVYVIPRDVWYIIPATLAVKRRSVWVRPGDEKNQFERYREAWGLLWEGAEAWGEEQGRSRKSKSKVRRQIEEVSAEVHARVVPGVV